MSFTSWIDGGATSTEFISCKRPRTGDTEDPDAVEIKPRFSADCGQHEGLVRMWRAGRFCDAVVETGGKKYKVHRAVLALSSKFFERAFSGSFAEAAGAAVQLDMTAEAWSAAAEFAYTGKVVLHQSSLLPMLEVANYLEMRALESYLIDAIANRVTPESFDAAWAVADRLSLPSLEKQLAHSIKGCAKTIRAFTITRDVASLPESIQASMRGENPLLKKAIRVLVPRDGSASAAKLAKTRRIFDLLGGTEQVVFTIDKQARVDLNFDVPPEACVGPSRFEVEQYLLEMSIAPGGVISLNTCSFDTSKSLSLDANRPLKYFYRDSTTPCAVSGVRVADGYPITVRAAPHAPPLSYYKLILDIGVSFESASDLLSRNEAQFGGEETGFYRSIEPMPGRALHACSLLLKAAEWDKFGARLYLVVTPTQGFKVASKMTLDRFLRKNVRYDLADTTPAAEWGALYDDALIHCKHGSGCGAGAENTLRKMLANNPSREAHGSSGSICMNGRRLRTIDLITGDALVPLWGLLEPKAVLSVRTNEDTELFGLWVDPAKVPTSMPAAISSSSTAE